MGKLTIIMLAYGAIGLPVALGCALIFPRCLFRPEPQPKDSPWMPPPSALARFAVVGVSRQPVDDVKHPETTALTNHL